MRFVTFSRVVVKSWCLFFSCSVTCFKAHECKEIQRDAFVIDANPDVKAEEKPYLLEIPDEFLVPDHILELLRHSDELKDLLRNHHLRDFLKFAHETYNPHGFMKVAMNEPLFVEFANACMKVLHPEEYSQKEPTDQEIVSRLSQALAEDSD